MSQNPDCKFLLLADLNCNIYDVSHCYTKLIRGLMEKHHLISAFDLLPTFDVNSAFTRFDNKTNSRTLIDGILMSNELRDVVSNIRISNYGNNVSDHLPVELTLRASVSVFEPQKHKSKPLINWGKLSQNDLELFEQKLTQGLNAIIIPSHGVFHGSNVCLNDSHKSLIKNYYDNIITAIINAESVLPKTNPSIHRSFWIEELSESKRVSLECTNFWKDSGKPLSGPIFQCKKNCQNR